MSTWRPNRGSQNYSSRGNRGTPRDTSSSISLPPDRDILEGLNVTPLSTLEKPSTVSNKKDIQVKDQEYIGSYNWLSAPEGQPTIIVPGSPREWRGRTLPYTVPRDTGAQYVDQNGYRIPSYPLLPLFRAADVMAEDATTDPIDWASVDFVTDRNGLRKLLRWIADEDGSAKEFRIDMELAGERTILLNRWEKRTREQADFTRPSYGFNFERESTNAVEGCERSTGHHRIVKFDFDGLKIVLRFEVDACLPQSETRKSKNTSSTTKTNVDDISNLLSGLNVTSIAPSDSSETILNDVQIRRGGSEVPQSAILELTTRSERYVDQFDWENAYPQLFLSQTPNHYLAVHSKGSFTHIIKHSLDSPELKKIDAGAQDSFRRLRRALQEIQDLAKKHGQRGRLTLVYRDGVMQAYQRTKNTSSLPDDVMQRFER